MPLGPTGLMRRDSTIPASWTWEGSITRSVSLLRSGTSESNYAVALANMGKAGSITGYFTGEPRHLLTTRSGHSIFRPLRGSEAVGKKLKPDVNALLSKVDGSGYPNMRPLGD